MELKKAENVFWALLVVLIIIVVCYTYYSIFSTIDHYLGIASTIIVGMLIFNECLPQRAPS